jgi:centromeric protein E
MILENESSEFTVPIEGCETGEDSSKEEKRNRKHSLLNWFKLRVILLYNSVE